ncbi:hypothetical protein [Micromonospora sp. NPDC049645]|uniref:hypothetical protein n=1 Tax=Micromonospora sp. NPDC049645 TaxID=3155508 RepID=UPI003444B853
MSATAVVETDTSGQPAEPEVEGDTARRIVAPTLGAGERRREVPVQIGEYEYSARCPKLVIWTDMAQLVEDRVEGNRAARRKAGAEPGITVDRVRLTSALSHFIAGCLSPNDWTHVQGQLEDSDNDVDLPDLWAAGMALVIEFYPDAKAMMDAMGMKTPKALGKLVDQGAAPAAGGRPARKVAGKKAAGKAR